MNQSYFSFYTFFFSLEAFQAGAGPGYFILLLFHMYTVVVIVADLLSLFFCVFFSVSPFLCPLFCVSFSVCLLFCVSPFLCVSFSLFPFLCLLFSVSQSLSVCVVLCYWSLLNSLTPKTTPCWILFRPVGTFSPCWNSFPWNLSPVGILPLLNFNPLLKSFPC